MPSSVSVLLDRVAADLCQAAFCAGNGGRLQPVVDVHVDAAVEVCTELRLQPGDKFPECFLLVRHDVGDQQGVQDAVALRQVALDADAAGFLAAHENVVRQHEVDDVFETDAVFVQGPAVFRRDAVQHLGGVEGAGNAAGPTLALQRPAQQHGKYLVGVDHVAVLVHGTDAVGVAVGNQAGIAVLRDDFNLGHRNVRQDRLGIDAGERRVAVRANLDGVHSSAIEDALQHAGTGAVQAVDEEAVARRPDGRQVRKALDGRNVVRQKIGRHNGRGNGCIGQCSAQKSLDLRNDAGRAGAAEAGLVFDAVPLRRIVRRRDHDAAGGTALSHAEGEGGRRCHAGRKQHRHTGAAQDTGNKLRKLRRAEACVVADADTRRCLLVRQHVVGDGAGGDADVRVGKVVGDDAAPAVCAELDGARLWEFRCHAYLHLSAVQISPLFRCTDQLS